MKTHHRLVLALAALLAFAPWSRAVQSAVYPPGTDAPPLGTWQSLYWVAAAALVAVGLLWKLSADSRAVPALVRVRRGD